MCAILSLFLFGGYVAVEGLDYGGSASGASSPGTMLLDGMGTYRPLPAKGNLLVLKNGAVRYDGGR